MTLRFLACVTGYRGRTLEEVRGGRVLSLRCPPEGKATAEHSSGATAPPSEQPPFLKASAFQKSSHYGAISGI